MSRAHLLLVDNDPQNLQLMEVSLRKVGFQVTTSRDGQDALSKATLLAPDLVLSEVELPGLDGFGLLEALRAEPRTAALPVVFLTQDTRGDRRAKAIEAGVVDYLSKPVFIKDIVARIRLHLQKSERQQQISDQHSEATGSLSDMGLVDLLRTLEGRTGVVGCAGTRGETATLWIRDGRVEDAELGQLAGEAAFYRLLTWSDGRWHFHLRDDERPERITLPPAQLLSEGLRRLDEWSRQLEMLSGLDAVYEVDFVVLAMRLGDVPDEVNAVLRLLDGRQTLRQVVEGSPFEDASTLATVNKLVREGLVRRVGGSTPGEGSWKPMSVPAAPAKDARLVGGAPSATSATDSKQTETAAPPASAEPDVVSESFLDGAETHGVTDPALEAAVAVSLEEELSESDEASAWAGGDDIDDDDLKSPDPLSSGELDAILAQEGLAARHEDKRELIEVMRYPARAGGRRRRLEEEARRALEEAAEGDEPLQVLANEALPPGARSDESLEQRVVASAAVEPQPVVDEPLVEDTPQFDPSNAVTMPAIEAFDAPEPDETQPAAASPDVVAASSVENDSPNSNVDDEDFSHIVKAGRRGPLVVVGVLAAVGIVAFFAFGSQKSPPTADGAKPEATVAHAPVKTPAPAPEPEPAVVEPVEAVEADPADVAEPVEIAEATQPEEGLEPAASAAFVPPAVTPVPAPARPKPVATEKDEVARLVGAVLAASKTENWTQVESTARRILMIDPNQPIALRELGKAQYNASQLEEARTSLLQATREASSDADAFMFLGIVYQELDRRDEAKQAYRRFLQLEPKGGPRYKDIASVLENMER